MRLHLALLCGTLSVLGIAVRAQNPPAHHLVEVRTTGPAQMQRLLALDLDLAGCTTPLPAQRRVEVIATDADLATLTASRLTFRVLQRDLEAHYAAAAARWPVQEGPNPPLGQGAMGGHWTLSQMESILDSLQALNPAICSARVTIGNSLESRSIWMVKISDNVGADESEPEVFYDALHHAREPLSMEATLVFMDWLVSNYGSDPLATFLVDERELYFVPCVNPDGYEYNRTTNPGGGGMWRKNRRNNGDGTFGVDLNRNYATFWNAPNGGSSTVTNSETYRGTAPFSEPETQVIEAFVQGRQFVSVFTTHTYTDVLLRPWGYVLGDPPNVADYSTIGGWLVQENGVPHGSISSQLYIAAGTSVDHHHQAHGMLAFSAELGRSDEGGFWPSGPTIADIALRHQPMFRKFALCAGAALEIADVAVAEAAGSNGNGVVETGETGEVVVTVANVGIVSAPNSALALQVATAGAAIGNGAVALGAVARLSTVDNSGNPMTFTVTAPPGQASVSLRLLLTGDGRTQERILDVPLIAPRPVVADDFELDHGFARATVGTATTGLWERAAPQQTLNGSTVIQPGFQTTPGGSRCWVTDGRAGASSGTYDVDNGYTDLLSPKLDLRHLLAAEARLSLWYAESAGNDSMQIDLSRDGGGSWTPLYSTSASTGAWVPLALDLGAPLTDRMQLRVRAQDLNASLVECLVDDFAVVGALPDGSITLLGSGKLGTTLQIAMHAEAGAFCLGLAAPALGPGVAFPGVGGVLQLDPAVTFALDGVIAGADGRAARELLLPLFPNLVGTPFHWQLASLTAVAAAFGGNVTTVVLQ